MRATIAYMAALHTQYIVGMRENDILFAFLGYRILNSFFFDAAEITPLREPPATYLLLHLRLSRVFVDATVSILHTAADAIVAAAARAAMREGYAVAIVATALWRNTVCRAARALRHAP